MAREVIVPGAGATTTREGRRQPAMAIIDCDVHAGASLADPRFASAFASYLPSRWQRYLQLRDVSYGADEQIPMQRRFAHRTDAVPPGGGTPGSDPDFSREQLLDEFGISAAILNSQTVNHAVAVGRPRALGRELIRANNDWIRDRWLSSDPRWFPTINVLPEDPHEATREIARCREASERFVGVYLPSRSEQPIGNPRYWPIFEAATHYDIPLVFHAAACATSQITACGVPNTYFENHVLLAQHVYTLVPSLIFEGVFDRFPTLKVVLVELGWSWAVPFARRLDASWRVMRKEVPHLQRAPSEYVRDHLWFTTQPIDEPARPEWLGGLLRQFEDFGLAERLLFSSDYPHWDFDSPAAAVSSPSFTDEQRRRILGANASALFGIPLT